jgi:flagellar biosynthesis/type III secretory pathway M-ring protein FliF/YscJ
MTIMEVIAFVFLLISIVLVFWIWADIIRDAIRRRRGNRKDLQKPV